jgi:hypothetical protein
MAHSAPERQHERPLDSPLRERGGKTLDETTFTRLRDVRCPLVVRPARSRCANAAHVIHGLQNQER